MLVLAELGVDLKPILAGAGILGLAIGFGRRRS
jgi:small-conductance mechanosensitive channel